MTGVDAVMSAGTNPPSASPASGIDREGQAGDNDGYHDDTENVSDVQFHDLIPIRLLHSQRVFRSKPRDAGQASG